MIRKHWLTIVIAVIALLVSFIYYSPPLNNENLIDDDVFQHLFWMDQWSDQYYFEEDLLKEYAQAVQPVGPAAIYRISNALIDPVQLSKILPIPLFVLSVLLIYFIGVRLGGRFNGVLSAATLMATPGYLIKMEGGLPRSFALPLLLLFLLLMLHKKHTWSSVVVVVQAMFYPLIAPVCLLVLAAGMLLPLKGISGTRMRKALIPMLVACIGCLALFLSQKNSAIEADIGSPVSSVEVRNNAEFSKGGRYPIDQSFLPAILHNFSRGTFYSRLPDTDNIQVIDVLRDAYRFLFFGLFVIVFFLAWQKDLFRIDSTLSYLLIASFLMYTAAYLFMLKLYIPVRQLEFTLPIWALLVQSLLISKGVSLLRSSEVQRAVRFVLIGGALLVCAIMLRVSISTPHFSKRELVDVSEYTELYAALRDLKAVGLIASHPSLADPIPTITGRRVLFNTAMALPFFDNYWSKINIRAQSFVEAYYSENINDVIKFCDAFNVDYIIVQSFHFSDEYLNKNHRIWEPYFTWERKASVNKNDFALMQISSKSIVYEDVDLIVVSVNDLRPD